MGGRMGKGRGHVERINADNLRAARLQPCARCGQRINYDLPRDHPDAFIAGHIKAWATHPALRTDPANLQPEHARCGKSAGTSDARGTGTTSRDW